MPPGRQKSIPANENRNEIPENKKGIALRPFPFTHTKSRNAYVHRVRVKFSPEASWKRDCSVVVSRKALSADRLSPPNGGVTARVCSARH